MGDVYRAHDPRLGRDVALKVLPADVAGDPERLARFKREARAVAALNHSHIVTIFSIEEADPPAGSGQAALPFMTMELVEGQSLSPRPASSSAPCRICRRSRSRPGPSIIAATFLAGRRALRDGHRHETVLRRIIARGDVVDPEGSSFRAQQTYVPFALLINAAEAAGETELAMDYARRSWEAREPGFILFARHNPEWAPLRADSRFQAILREMDTPIQDGD